MAITTAPTIAVKRSPCKKASRAASSSAAPRRAVLIAGTARLGAVSPSAKP